MKYLPYNYQKFAQKHLLNKPEACLFMDMGLGKTVITLTAIQKLMYEDFEVSRALIIAPKLVSENTWTDEIEKWDHLHLKSLIISGPAKKRTELLYSTTDLYIISVGLVSWLVATLKGYWPFDMIVIDELSMFKSTNANRFRALKLMRPKSKRVIGLTGTPSGNGLNDLWSEMYLIDQGKRLGLTVTGYRDYYLSKKESGWGYRCSPIAEKAIFEKIKDICISMRIEDYHELPEKIINDYKLDFSDEGKQRYKKFERELILDFLSQEVDITVLNAAGLMNKLLQFANGFVYDENKVAHDVDDTKMEALAEIIESNPGKSILIFYSFKHDLTRIVSRFKAVPMKGREQIELWNKNKIPLMIAHPKSAAHGLNLQAGGDIILFFGLPHSLELYLQAIARLHRLGRLKPILVLRLLMKGTVDMDVAKNLVWKEEGQDRLLNAVKALINKYR